MVRKYLELVQDSFTQEHFDKQAIQNWPYTAYSIKDSQVFYTIIPKPVADGPWVTFTAEEDNSSIGLTKLSTNQTLEYSTDTAVWNVFDTATDIPLNSGDKVYVRGILSADNKASQCTQFKMTGKIAASGNCNALWNYNDLEAPLKAYCGYKMFYDCTSLTTAPELPAIALADDCYGLMFYNCSSLTQAPKLPATTLTDYCYNATFSGCTSLTTAPELPATTLTYYCYCCMFQNCTSLTKAPELPATTLADNCYASMFNGCAALTTAPELPATTVTRFCYSYMFAGCTSLTTAPDLPATTLDYHSYEWMFYNCSNLRYIKCLATDVSASDCTTCWVLGVAAEGEFVKDPNMTRWYIGSKNGIPKGWKGSEANIYPSNYVTFTAEDDNSSIGLTKLSSSHKLYWSKNATDWYQMDTSDNISLSAGNKLYIVGTLSSDNTSRKYTQFKMTGKIAASGNCNAIWNYEDLSAPLKSYCGYYLFRDCASLTIAPELPATTLASNCYASMFSGCTSLTTAPELPATTLVSSCYYSMFYNCTSLTTVPELPATTLANYCYGYMFQNCSNLNYIKCLATDISASGCTSEWVSNVASSGTFIKHPEMSNWKTGTVGTPSGWTVVDAVL